MLRDIYVAGASVEDWQRVVEAIRAAGWPTSYLEDHETVSMPADVHDVFATLARTVAVLWKVRITKTATVNDHFYGATESDVEIEFNIAPSEITDQPSLDAVCDFMRVVGRSAHRPVWVGVECSGSDRPPADMHYDPATDSIRLRDT